MKHFSLLALACLSFATMTSAQEKKEKNYYAYPHQFIGLQGGIQNTFYKNDMGNWSNITPTASISYGAWFNNFFGARLHVNGVWGKGSLTPYDGSDDRHFNYKYITPSADALINLCTLFGKKEVYPVNVILIMGLGANYAWDNKECLELTTTDPRCHNINAANDDRWAFNARGGVGLDIPLCKNLSLTMEADLNYMVPGNSEKFVTDNLMFLGQAGLNIKFGHKKKPVVAEEPVYETRIDTVWYDDIAYSPRVENGNTSWNVFYQIRESEFNDPDAQLAAIGAFLKDHRECKVSIKSYADVQTGNPRVNMGYSKARAEKAVEALTKAGVDPSIITSEYFGDTVQPFAENDKNRVSIITVTGLKDVKDKYTVKKFRTKETQVRVN